MPEGVAECVERFTVADPLAGLAGGSFPRTHNAPSARHFRANIGPSAGVAVADIVDVPCASGPQGEKAERGQIFDMNQVHEFLRGADTPLADLLHWKETRVWGDAAYSGVTRADSAARS